MKLIAHRGNLQGPTATENNPNFIDEALEAGYDAEIDVRYDSYSQMWYLGHDYAQYHIKWEWLLERKDRLWVHCKNLGALHMLGRTPDFNYFWHQNDDFTLTSKGFIWTYPGNETTPNSVIVMPESPYGVSCMKRKTFIVQPYSCYGVCSDYVGIV